MEGELHRSCCGTNWHESPPPSAIVYVSKKERRRHPSILKERRRHPSTHIFSYSTQLLLAVLICLPGEPLSGGERCAAYRAVGGSLARSAAGPPLEFGKRWSRFWQIHGRRHRGVSTSRVRESEQNHRPPARTERRAHVRGNQALTL